MKVISTNRKARYEYHVFDTMETGIVLTGTEIKSVRAAKVNFKDSYARCENGEVFLYGMHISPYDKGNRYNADPERTRKLLLHKQEIRRLAGKVTEKGMTLIPLKLYLKKSLLKVELGVARGKKTYDKRQAIAKKDMERMRAVEEKGKLR